VRQVTPGDSGAVDVEDRIEDLAQAWVGMRPLIPRAVRASVRAWRQAVRRGSIRAQRASDRSDGYARRSVMTWAYGGTWRAAGRRVRQLRADS
jgi:hypothetical protein